jgi:hypothetical protein
MAEGNKGTEWRPAKLLDGQKVVANLDGVLDSLSDPVLVWEDAP